MSFAVRNSRFPHMCRALLRFLHLSFIPPVPYPPLRGTFPSRGRLCIGDSDALVYDALETISSPSFIPLVPYPARFARHLPHAGKALPVVILFPHMRVFALTMREKRHSRIAALPIGERGPRSGTLVNGVLETISHSLSYRHCPIRFASLATFPTRGRLCLAETTALSQMAHLRRSPHSLSYR